MFQIQTLNKIADRGIDLFPHDRYEVASHIEDPDAIILRSYNLHDHQFSDSVKVVARAGAGVNNIPVEKLTQLGIPVFNTPGANANAVKELVLTGMLLAMRHVCDGWAFAQQLQGSDQQISTTVESEKKQFVGNELQGKTLGVIGLGAIGVKVANIALSLDMKVIGFDPQITVQRAWELSSVVKEAETLDEVLIHSDIVTVHVPLIEETKHFIDAARIATMKPNTILLNFARQEVVDESAVISALNEKHLQCYVTDFPSKQALKHPQVVALPHLGASTREAEENCACMAVKEVRDYLEQGHISYSVNFPSVNMPRGSKYRIVIVNKNVPKMVGQISSLLGTYDINIVDLINRSRGDIAVTLLDVDDEVEESVEGSLRGLEGVLSVRVV